MFDWLFKGNDQPIQSYKFQPTVQIHPTSNVYIECTPNDPHTASNIVINTYISKTNRTLLQTRIQWSRFKFISDSQHSVENLTYVTGNVYRCQPSDLGSYIKAKITSVDVSCTGEGEVTIGPIRIDEILKNVVDGALYDKSLRSQVKIVQKNVQKNGDIILSDRDLRFTEQNSGEKLIIDYSISEPRIELNPKDPTRIFLRFEQDEKNTVRQWLNTIFPENASQISDRVSEKSRNSSSSKSRLFKSLHCINKIEVIFLTRNCRDLFLFTQKAFICKELMKNSIVLLKVQQMHEMKTEQDYHRFLTFMSLKYEIFRLAELAKEFQKDRDQKVKDITELEDSIGEMTLTYMKIIEQKGKSLNVDFNQSYSQISIKREEIMGKRNLRQLMSENESLKKTIRQLNEELEYQKFFKKQNNDSMVFNQTTNPFMKKGGIAESMIPSNQGFDEERSRQNLLQINRSYMKVLEENERLKNKNLLANPNISQDMVELLESLHEEDQDPNKVNAKLKIQKKQLQLKVAELEEALAKKSQPSLRLNQSIAHQKHQNSQVHNLSNVEENSFLSISNMNQSMSEYVMIKMLEEDLVKIRELNKKIEDENIRLRRERDEERSRNMSKSNTNFESEIVYRLKEENEKLMNEKNALSRKIESLSVMAEENKNLKVKIQSLKTSNQSSEGSVQNNREYLRMKKINNELLEEIKSLKIQLENRSDPIYNSRVIELQTEVKFLKTKQGDNHDNATVKLLQENSKLKKQIENLKRQISDKDAKLESQTILLDRLMNSTDSNSITGKDKSYSETRNEGKSVEKLQKKIKVLQEEIVMLRRSNDVINRSNDFSMQMNCYNEERLEELIRQNERISRICEKYAREAKQKNKWEKMALELQKKLNEKKFDQF